MIIHIRPRAIGLSGFAGTGKTEVAKYIEAEYGFERRHIAEPLRRMIASLLRDWGFDDKTINRYLVGDLKEAVIPGIGRTSRHLQITLGTEWGRGQVDQDLWANLWVRQAEIARTRTPPPMNDSVRFPNEETAIRDMRGITIMITRPGTGPAAFKWKWLGPKLYRWFGCMWGVHDSERTDRLTPDYVIANDGTLDQLRNKIEMVMHTVTHR